MWNLEINTELKTSFIHNGKMLQYTIIPHESCNWQFVSKIKGKLFC